jgi:integral membrane protein (TIGR01906 family)
MPGMHAVDASRSTLPAVAPRTTAVASVLLSAATVLAIVALAILPLLTPWFIHPALDAANAAAWLGTSSVAAHALSDQTVSELVLGPATFAFPGPDLQPFYDPAEAAHLRDARALLLFALAAGGVSLLGIFVALARRADRRGTWRAISHGGLAVAIVVGVLGIGAVIAFGPLFELFHRVFFPGGNWAFDPSTQHLVRLYPLAFWQIAAAAFGVIAFLLGLGTWWLGRRQALRPREAGR